MAVSERKTGVIYYDCTNFYFEIEQAEDDKQYGLSKENRPLPIVEMGLFMDAEGIPLAFCINPGNQNEQLSMISLEKKLLTNFDLSRFVVCTDAGLSSTANRIFNDYDKGEATRAFITTQSIKKLKKHLKEWALNADGWSYRDKKGNLVSCSLSDLDETEHKDTTFYKSRWIKETVEVQTGTTTKKVVLEQQLIISYSIKYKDYCRTIRDRQIKRALKTVEKGGNALNQKKPNDPKRFIKTEHATKDGEIAQHSICYLDETAISKEDMFDGCYGVCTNLEDSPETIVRSNKRRWEIEECFRIMKNEFEARPVYLQRQERIVAHFIICFIALIIYRYLEKKLGERYTCSQIIETLQEMNFIKYEGKGYQPTYTRTKLTDDLHQTFGFSTSTQIVPVKKMKKICADTKK